MVGVGDVLNFWTGPTSKKTTQSLVKRTRTDAFWLSLKLHISCQRWSNYALGQTSLAICTAACAISGYNAKAFLQTLCVSQSLKQTDCNRCKIKVEVMPHAITFSGTGWVIFLVFFYRAHPENCIFFILFAKDNHFNDWVFHVVSQCFRNRTQLRGGRGWMCRKFVQLHKQFILRQHWRRLHLPMPGGLQVRKKC